MSKVSHGWPIGPASVPTTIFSGLWSISTRCRILVASCWEEVGAWRRSAIFRPQRSRSTSQGSICLIRRAMARAKAA